MAAQTEKMVYESALQRLIRRELKALEKKISELENLIHGDWFLEHLRLQQEIIDKTRTLKPREAAAYLESVAPREKELAKKAKQSAKYMKLFDKQSDLERIKRELEDELMRVTFRDENHARYLEEIEKDRAAYRAMVEAEEAEA